jgi:hypothetical protein
VNRITWRAVKVGLPLSAAAGIVALASSGAHALLLDVYLLCIGAVVLLALVRVTRAQAPAPRRSQFDQALAAMRRRPSDSGEPTLVRDLELATYNEFHLHSRIRPMMRDVAAHRLRARYGVELDAEAGRARELVGPHAWELVRPDRPAPRDRLARGPSVEELERVVDDLEAI